MSWNSKPISSPQDVSELDELCNDLRTLATSQTEDSWPSKQLQRCAEAGVFRWFIPREFGGFEWNNEQIVEGYLKLSSACLKTTFVITQRTAACRRIVASQTSHLPRRLLPKLATGELFATVGISHLTTSRQHLGKPALHARESDSGFLISGFSPWVTGGRAADYLVMGAELDDGRQILFALSASADGISMDPAQQLVGLSGSETGAVRCKNVNVDQDLILAGPVANVMSHGTGGGTGGFQTSTLAIGLAAAAIEYIGEQAAQRTGLLEQFESLNDQLQQVRNDLLAAARGEDAPSKDELRTVANSLVLRATQSALVAAKGAGYIQGHPVGRWCKEALFFLVWSCPQSVLDANLCELAGTSE